MKLAALIRKEFHRFFHDPRLIVTMLLPGLLIFALYSILGEVIYTDEQETYEYKAYLMGSSEAVTLIDAAFEGAGSDLEWLPAEDEETARAEVEKGNAAALIVFSENFDAYGEGANVAIYYKMDDDASYQFYALVSAVLTEYGMPFAIVSNPIGEENLGMTVMRSVLPLLLVCFIFSACMSVTLESVAGEKERGTLSTVLVTSVKRSHVALGKVVPLSCISMLGALSSFLGVAFSMPKLMGVSFGFLGSYGFASYALMFLLILSVPPLIVALISVFSTLSRSMKEASAYTSALMIVSMVVSLIASFVPAMGNWALCVPVLNAVVTLQTILDGGVPVWQTFVSMGANVLYTALLVYLMTRLLSSERIMFGK